jgi:predicted TIM-barrel fold metal-dependent hydrolase
MGVRIAIICGTLLLQLSSFAQDEVPAADNHVHVRSQRTANAWLQINRANPALSKPSTLPTRLAQDILLDLDLAGIEKALLVSEAHVFAMPELNPSGEYALVRAENDFVAEQIAAAPQRLAGLCGLNPLADYALEEVQRCAQILNLAGVSLHFSDSDINLRSNDHLVKLGQFFEFLKVLEFPVLIHLATRNPHYGSVDVKLFIDNILINTPALDIQIAHFGGHEEFTVQTDRAMSEFILAFADGRLQPAKVQFDLAKSPSMPANSATALDQNRQKRPNTMYAQRIRQLDPQQVLFASSWTEKPGDSSRLAITQVRNNLALTPQTIASFFPTLSRLFGQ